jgi:sodium/bile acid cotransporter 7
MMGFARKHWFLLLILAGTVTVVVRPQWLGWTVWLNPSLFGATAVFLAAWTLETRSLGKAILRPQAALWAMVISYGLLPGMAWAAGGLLEPDFQVGVLLIASVPCTLASAVIWTRMAGGDEATTLLITFLTNCTSWLITTAWLTLVTGVSVPSGWAGTMMGRLFLVLVAPVALGQLLRAARPLRRVAAAHKIPLGVVARLMTFAIMLKAGVEVRARVDADGAVTGPGAFLGVAALCLSLHLAALYCGLWTSKGLGFDRPNQIASAIGGSQKTLPIALILFDAYFVRDFPLAVVPAVFYHFGQLIVDTFIAHRLVDRPLPVEESPAENVVDV